MKGPRCLIATLLFFGVISAHSSGRSANHIAFGAALSDNTTPNRIAALPTARDQEAIRLLKQEKLYDSLGVAYQAAPYRVERSGQAAMERPSAVYHASNPAQDMSANFRSEGVYITAGESISAGSSWVLRLTGYGYGDSLQAAVPAEPTANENRVEYARGVLKEWYINDSHGLEQGFTLAQPPAAPTGEPLMLMMTVETELRTSPDNDPARIAFVDSADRVRLQYASLKAWDASGKDLRATIEARSGQIRLRIDDSGATYPVTIDPIIYTETKINASDGHSHNQFGFSVATDENTVVVGTPNVSFRYGRPTDPGSAYVFERSGTAWIQQAKLTASDGVPNDGFGTSVAISGDTIVVGSQLYNSTGLWSGSVYVFRRHGTIWSQQQKLTPDDAIPGSVFGIPVAISRHTIVVGARLHSSPGQWEGSVYVFGRHGNIWSQQQKLTASDAIPGLFGASVAISGDTVVVGAPFVPDTSACQNDPGSVYVFVRRRDTWTQQEKLTVGDAGPCKWFGASVAISDDETVVVGAPLDNNGGSAYVFDRFGIRWIQGPKITASDVGSFWLFGKSVAISDDTIVAAASISGPAPNHSDGAAYVFKRTRLLWSQEARLTSSYASRGDLFGTSVAATDDTVVAGAPVAEPFGGSRPTGGSAYIYTLVACNAKNDEDDVEGCSDSSSR